MGLLQDGKWVDQWYKTGDTGGVFLRQSAQFRNWVTADGSPGPTGSGGFKAEGNRYHLYISLACPWAHRTLIFRALKGLEKIISLSVVHWYMAEHGWTFAPGAGVLPDNVNGATLLHQIYTSADLNYSGRVTVPVLWDKKQQTIVSNESAEIIRMFNGAFDCFGDTKVDYYPEALQLEINQLNDRIYNTINNGVYKAGFATTQKAYQEAVIPLFDTLNWIENILTQRRYLTGNSITEADWRLFTTLVRFDPVYVGHFKCNLQKIADYPNILGYVRDLYQQPGIAQTVNMQHIKYHYYQSHDTINPTRIVPVGPEADYTLPHDRSKFE